MSTRHPAIRRICFAVDIEGYSRRTAPEQVDFQKRLSWIVVQALRVSGISPRKCERQDQGDGQLVLLPSGIDEGSTLPTLVTVTHAALDRVNTPPGAGGRLRLRLALAQGPVQIGATGYVGVAVVETCRLLDSDPPRQALKHRQDTDLVMIISDDSYHQVFAQEYAPTPARADFRPVRVVQKSKDFICDAYLYVPGTPAPRGVVPIYTGTGHDPQTGRPWLSSIPAVARASLAVGPAGIAAGRWWADEQHGQEVHDQAPSEAETGKLSDEQHTVVHWAYDGPDVDPQDPTPDWEHDRFQEDGYESFDLDQEDGGLDAQSDTCSTANGELDNAWQDPGLSDSGWTDAEGHDTAV